MGKRYTYREHGTNARITTDKPITSSEAGNDVTQLSVADVPDEPAPAPTPAPAPAPKAE